MHGGLTVDGQPIKHSLNDEEGSGVALIDRNIPNSDEQGINITHIAGTIDSDEKERLKKLLFRATRGKALTYFSDYEVLNAAGVA